MRGVLVDRALIDAAIAAGKVRRFPAGMFALDYTKGINLAEARRANLANRRRVGLPTGRAHSSKQRPSPTQAAALRDEGLTYDQIAARLGIVKSYAWALVKRAGCP